MYNKQIAGAGRQFPFYIVFITISRGNVKREKTAFSSTVDGCAIFHGPGQLDTGTGLPGPPSPRGPRKRDDGAQGPNI